MKRVVALRHSIFAIVFFVVSPPVHSQGTRADYDRALGLSERFEKEVFCDRIRPRWLDDDRHFWYRVETGTDSHEFILVDAETGTCQPAVNALVEADKDFDLLILPGTRHGAAETAYGNRRRLDHFVRHLLGVEPRSR